MSDMSGQPLPCARRCVRKMGSMRHLSLGFLLLLVLSVAVAARAFAATESRNGVTPQMLSFLGAIVVSRFGLYSFELGLLQLEQAKHSIG